MRAKKRFETLSAALRRLVAGSAPSVDGCAAEGCAGSDVAARSVVGSACCSGSEGSSSSAPARLRLLVAAPLRDVGRNARVSRIPNK